MLFNSLTFFVFFAVVLALYSLPFAWRAKKVFLLLASYVFYAAWNPPLVLLLMLTTVVDWLFAARIDRTKNPRLRRLYLGISLIGNLGMLGFFKYGGFLLENFVAIVNLFGLDYHPARPGFILPLGISFYTFESLSYVIDVYRGQRKPARQFVDFALFVTFFPHLIAGPIVRAKDFIPQLATPKRATRDQLGWGLSLLIIGLFEKVILADTILSPLADKVYNRVELVGFISAWAGTLAFSAQIFFDFAGYSTCALGVAMCFGFALTKNFHYPYAAVGFADFWNRWHISLSTWLRDYVYFSIGGLRKHPFNLYRNVMLTMLIGGLWHGASWRFVVWGALHGAYLVVERFLREAFARRRPRVKPLQLAPDLVASSEKGAILLPAWLAPVSLMLLTYFLVCVTWVFFRAQDFTTALKILTAMCGLGHEQFKMKREAVFLLFFTAGMLAVHWKLRNLDLADVVKHIPWWVRSVLLSAMLVILTFALLLGDDRAFIYFQF
jgi:alginate O-acetyltransferase complex protein AlgI